MGRKKHRDNPHNSDAKKEVISKPFTEYNLLLNTALLGVIFIDHKQQLVAHNFKAKEIFQDKLVKGAPLSNLLSSVDRETLLTIEKKTSRGEAYTLKTGLEVSNGKSKRYWLEFNPAIQKNKDEKVVPILFREVSDSEGNSTLEAPYPASQSSTIFLRYQLWPDGGEKIHYLSSNSEEIWGVKPQAAIENPKILWNLVYEKDLEEFKVQLEQSAQTGNPFLNTSRFLLQDGKIKWHKTIGFPRRQDDGSTIWNISLCDVTGEKAVEIKLEAITNKLPAIVLQYKLHPDGTDEILYISRGVKKLLGLTEKDFNNQNNSIWDQIHPEDLEDLKQSVFESAKQMEDWHAEWRIVHQSGEIRWHHGSGSPIKQKDGCIIWNALILDITAEKKTSEALKASENKFRSLLENMNKIGVQSCGPDLKVNYWNRGSEEIYGYLKEEAYGKKLSDLIFPSEQKKKAERELQKIFKDQKTGIHKVVVMENKGGEPIPIYSSIVLLQMPGKEVELFRIDVDLRDRKRVENRLRNALHELSERVKEQKVLFDISNLNEVKLSTSQLLEQAAKLLTTGFTQPQKTGIRIQWADFEVSTPNFMPSDPHLSVSSKKSLKNPLQIEVSLTNNAIDNPILEEEVQLIKTVSDLLALKIAQKLALGELEKNRKSLHKIMNQSLDIICTLNKKAEFVNLGAACYTIWGMEPDELIGKPIYDIILKEDLEVTKSELDRVAKGKPINNFEIKCETKDGSVLEMNWSFNWDDTDQLYYCVGRDTTLLKKTERQLYSSDKKFRALLNEGSDRIAILDRDGVYTYLSPNYEKATGYKPNELMSLNSFDLIHPEDREVIIATFKKLKKSKRVTTPYFRYRKKDGKWYWMEAVGNNLLNDPNIKGFVINTREITERIKAEKALKYSEQKYGNLFNVTPLPIWVSDLHTLEILDVNQTALDHYGYSREEFLKLTVKDLRPPEEVPKLLKTVDILKNIEKNKIVPLGVFTHQKKNKELMRMDIRAHFVNYDSRDSLYVVCQDITDQEKVFEELRKSNERFEMITKATFGAVWDWNLETDTIFRGKRFEEIFGHAQEEIDPEVGVWDQFIHPEDKSAVIQSLQKTIEGYENYWTDDYRFKNKEGNYLYVRDRAIIIRDDKGKATRIIGVQRDVTEERYFELLEKIERNVLELNATKSHSIDHIVNTYMSGIEDLHPHMRCTLLEIVDNKLKNIASPSMPAEFIDAIEGEEIGPNKGSCGTAAFLNETIIAEDVFTDPRWEGFSQLGKDYNFKACCSIPISNSKGEVIATFAAYFDENASPAESEMQTAERASNFLKIILESHSQRQELIASNERYEYVNKATQDAIYDWEVPTDKLFWGESFNRLFGFAYGKEPVEVKEWADLIHVDDRPEIMDDLNRFLTTKGETNWTSNYRFQRNDGKFAYVTENGYLIRDEQGNPVRMIGVLRDISQIKEEEHRLKLLESVVTHTHDSIMITEADPIEGNGPKILYVNDAFTQMTGYKSEEILGKTPRVLQGPRTSREELDRFKKALKNYEPFEVELINYRKNREEFWISIAVTPIADETGTHTHFIAVERDITERKNLELQKQLVAEISQLFNKETSLNKAINRSLQTIVKVMGVNVAELWLVDLNREKIKLADRCVRGQEGTQFHKTSNNIKEMKGGEGTIGICWKKGKPQFRENLISDSNFLRKKAANQSDLNSAMAFPLFQNNEVIGVLNLILTDKKTINLYRNLIPQLTNHFANEIQRKKLEEELNSLFDTTPDIISISSSDGYFKRINSAAVDLLGYSENELLNKPIIDFVYPEDVKETRRVMTPKKKKSSNRSFENRMVAQNGEVKWFSWAISSSPEKDMLFGVAKDITEKKELEKLLEQATSLSQIGGWEVNLETKTLFWSDMVKKIHEVDKGFIPDFENAFRFYSNESAQNNIFKAFENIIETGTEIDIEVPINTGKGNKKWVKLRAEGVFENGVCKKITGSIQDVNDRKKAQIQLARKTQFIDGLYQVSTGLLHFDQWIEVVNQSIEIIGKVLNGDRVYYFENHQDEKTGKILSCQKLEWASDSVESLIDSPDLQNVEIDQFPEFFAPLKKGKPFNSIVSKMEDSYAKELFQSQGVRSILCLPIFVKKQFWGFIGIDDCSNESKWSPEEINFLSSISYNFASAIEKQENKKDLEKAYQEKTNILESIDDAFFTVNKHWKITYWNRRAEEILQKSREEVIGKNFWKLYPNEKKSNFFHNYHKAIQSQESMHFEEFAPILNIWLDVSAYPSESGLSVYIKDASLRKEAQQKIHQSNERFLKISEATEDVIWDWDIKSDKTFWGEGFKKLFGYSAAKNKEEAFSWADNIHPDDQEKVVDSLQNTLKQKNSNSWKAEYSYRKADGNYVHIIDRASIIRDEKGEAVRMIGAMQDISHRKQYEETLKSLNAELEQRAIELAESNRELEQFAYVASHDLQEPLRMITSFLTQLDKKYSDEIGERGKKYIYFAVDGARRMRKIIMDLLEYSRVGRMDLEDEQVDLNEIIEEIQLLYRTLIQESDAEIIIRKTLPTLQFPRSPILQVLQNLISNALKYKKSSENSKIEINAIEEPDFWQFSVRDNGIGIDPEFHEKVFAVFQRLHSREEIEGTGMGLALSKKIVESLGGKMWLDSAEGKGSTFYFTLPKN